jgi:hypothetical protein
MGAIYYPFFELTSQVMPGTYITDVADGVVKHLNAIDWAELLPRKFIPEYTAKRVYVPLEELTTLDQLTVLVRAPRQDQFEVEAVGGENIGEIVTVEVAVLLHLPGEIEPTNPATCGPIDSLVAITRMMAMSFQPDDDENANIVCGPGVWFDTEYATVYDENLLKTDRVFLGAFKLKFRMQESD